MTKNPGLTVILSFYFALVISSPNAKNRMEILYAILDRALYIPPSFNGISLAAKKQIPTAKAHSQ